MKTKRLIIRKCKCSIKTVFLSLIEPLSAKYNLTKERFREWVDTIKSNFEEKY